MLLCDKLIYTYINSLLRVPRLTSISGVAGGSHTTQWRTTSRRRRPIPIITSPTSSPARPTTMHKSHGSVTLNITVVCSAHLSIISRIYAFSLPRSLLFPLHILHKNSVKSSFYDSPFVCLDSCTTPPHSIIIYIARVIPVVGSWVRVT